MKRSWIGFFLLILLLVASLLSTRVMVGIHEPVEAALSQAARYAMAGQWDQAEAVFREAEDGWDRWEHLRSCFADHTPVEDIDAAFALLKVYCTAEEQTAFEGACRELARRVAAVGEAHELVWWNLL